MLLSQPRCYMSLLALSLLLIVPMAIGSNFVFHLFILACSYAALASAWNIVGGFAGQLSLGHAAFYGVGAYTSTLLMMHFGVSPWLGMFAARCCRPCWRCWSAGRAFVCAGRSSRWRLSLCWR